MERYELGNGDIYDIIRFSDECAVIKNGNVVYSGTYAGCRRFIEIMRKK